VIDEDEPQRQSTAGIEPQVTAIAIAMDGRSLPSPPQMIGHGLDQPRRSPDFPNALYVADSQAAVCIRHIAGDISALQALRHFPRCGARACAGIVKLIGIISLTRYLSR
jgi:hypothetical protein